MLWSKILESSLWVRESKETRLLWITLLAMKNSRGQIFASRVGLADRAKISVEECLKSLKVLMAPDPYDSSGVEEGRRIREIPGGWEIVNHDLYRFSTDAKREFWRVQKSNQREVLKKTKLRKKGGSLREKIYEQNQGGVQEVPQDPVLEKPVPVSEGESGVPMPGLRGEDSSRSPSPTIPGGLVSDEIGGPGSFVPPVP